MRIFVVVSLFFLVTTSSCAERKDLKHGRVTMHDSMDKNSFTFSVSDEFLLSNKDSPEDKENPKMSVAESGLLKKVLKDRHYCLNKYGSPVFSIKTRQEKIYDITFAHLIESNYNARSVLTRMYFGQCDSPSLPK